MVTTKQIRDGSEFNSSWKPFCDVWISDNDNFCQYTQLEMSAVGIYRLKVNNGKVEQGGKYVQR